MSVSPEPYYKKNKKSFKKLLTNLNKKCIIIIEKQKKGIDKMKKITRKNKIEMLIGRAVINIILAIIGTGLVLGFFWVLGLAMQLMEMFPVLAVILGIVDIILIFKEIQ